jgi:hypothetical protein
VFKRLLFSVVGSFVINYDPNVNRVAFSEYNNWFTLKVNYV